MGTAVGSETKPTKTVKRSYLLHVQVRNLLSRTTDISQQTLAKFDTGTQESVDTKDRGLRAE
jgi:hypothetical protein